jgi:hypothetical protein
MRLIASRYIGIFCCIVSFQTVLGLEPTRELLEVPKKDAIKVEPIELASVTFAPKQKTMVLKFTPQEAGIELKDVAVIVTFYIQTPNGLKQVDFDPPIDGIKWEAPDANNKMNSLRLSSVGQFDQMTVELQHKEDVKGSWTYKNEEKKKEAEQGGTGQPATRPESKSEGSDKPQPESEGRPR